MVKLIELTITQALPRIPIVAEVIAHCLTDNHYYIAFNDREDDLKIILDDAKRTRDLCGQCNPGCEVAKLIQKLEKVTAQIS